MEQARKRQKKQELEKKKAANPLLEQLRALRASWPKDMPRLLDSSLDSDRRAALWELSMEGCDRLRREFSWAVPDERALKVLAHYAPIVEVGAGKGYWASLLRAEGVDVAVYDRHAPDQTFTEVEEGGAEVLLERRHAASTLFLCYPDDGAVADEDEEDGCDAEAEQEEEPQKTSKNIAKAAAANSEDCDEEAEEEEKEEEDGDASLGLACLRAFQGETVVMVGESFLCGSLSMCQAPWGRSADSEFQVELATLFHPVLIAPLPRWPISKDCIVVFKRTKVCPIVFEKDPDDPDDQDDDDDDDDEQDYWADIPHDECLMLECAAPCAQHLLARPARRAGR